jgi:glycosyltransferase involved in cell wall biosynthesis
MPRDRRSCMQTLVVIPTYNEREAITDLTAAIAALHAEVVVLVVDDNSPDGTGSLIQALGQQNPRVRLLSRPSKQDWAVHISRGSALHCDTALRGS